MTGFDKLGIGPDKPPKLILDFCWNHEGSIGRVRQMLQRLREVLTPEQYQLIIPKFQAGRDLTWDRPMYRGVKRMCEDEFGLPFLCTAFDYKAVDMLVSIGVDAIKIGSAEADSFEFVSYAAKTGKPLIVSTGGKSNVEAMGLGSFLALEQAEALILHCVSRYPASLIDLKLDMLNQWSYWDGHNGVSHNLYGGYSSHYPEAIDAVFAMALGAQVIEKHYSLTPTSTPGAQGDHLVSIGAYQAKIICDASLAWHKMRGYTKSQETLEAERALLKPFREQFYANNHRADQTPGQDQIQGNNAGRPDSERS